MDKKNNTIMYVGIAIFIIVTIIVVWFMTKKKEEEEENGNGNGNGDDEEEHIPPFDEDHPGYTGAEFVETYKGIDIWYWAGKPNPYIAFTTIRQWFETIIQARNRISDHVGY